jgi:ABC-type branched-subunit amino acid transport system permease subunit
MARQLVFGLALIAALAVFPLFSPWSTVILTVALCEGLAALGIMVLLRAGQVSFGHGLFFSFSAYAVAFMAAAKVGHEALILIPVGMAASGLLAAIVGLFVVRYRAIFFGMLNLAMSMVFYSLLEKLYDHRRQRRQARVAIMPSPAIDARTASSSNGRDLLRHRSCSASFVLGSSSPATSASPDAARRWPAIKTNETRLEYLGVLPAQACCYAAYLLSACWQGIGGAIIAHGHPATSRRCCPTGPHPASSSSSRSSAALAASPGPSLAALMFLRTHPHYAAVYAPDAWHADPRRRAAGHHLLRAGGLYGIVRAMAASRSARRAA